MLLVIKLIMRGCALFVAGAVLWGVHELMPKVNPLVSSMGFISLWMAFAFAVVLLASSWVVGRAGGGDKGWKGVNHISAAEIDALRKKLNPVCRVEDCEEYTEPGSRYCVAHTVKPAQGGGQ